MELNFGKAIHPTEITLFITLFPRKRNDFEAFLFHLPFGGQR
jgi:hypothetical protein